MPVLPKLETSQSVFSDGALASQQIQSSPEDFGGQVAQAVGGIGQAGNRVSGDLADTAMMYKGIRDENSANDAYNSFTNDVRDTTTGLYQQQGKAAVEAVPAANKAIEDARQRYRESLTDPQAQRMFDQVSTRHVQNILDENARFGSVQQKTYEDQTSDGMVNNFQQQAAQVWNDPNAFNGQLSNIATERTTHGLMRGEPQEYINAKIQSDVSGSWIDRLKGIAAAGDAQTALTLLKNGEDWTDSTGRQRHTDVRSQILPAQLSAIQAQLSSHAADQIGVSYGNTATAPPPTSDRLVDAFMGQETSGGKNVKTSVNGARGPMQIEQDTFNQYAKPGENIDNDADNRAVGARILQDYSAKYNGDPARIAVAYFSGPGNVATSGPTPWKNNTADGNGVTVQQYVQGIQNLLAKSQPAGAAAGAVSGTLPVGNAAGVPNAAQIAPQPVGLAQDPVAMKANQDANAEQARQAAQAHVLELTNDPIAAKRAGDIAASTVVGNTNTAIAAAQSRQQAAAGMVSKLIAGDPTSGAQPITSFAQLVANPVAYANYSQLSPQGQAAVTERLTNPGALHMTQDSLNTYYKLKGEAVDDPESFAKEDLSQQFGKMPEAQLMQLINQQSTVAKRDASSQSRALNWGRTKGEVSDIVNSAIPKDDPNKADRTTMFYGKLQEALDQYHDQNQKYPDAQTTRKIAGGLVAQGTQGAPSMLPSWLGGNSTIRAFESPDLNNFQAAIPPDQKPQLVASFQKVMGRAPTDDELSQAYTAYTLHRKAK